MSYDLFISYAHQGDDTSREAVTALVVRVHAALETDFRQRFNRDLKIFFDKGNIRGFEHWQVSCHRALQTSRFFIACLSRSYLRSDACRWEWEEWCKHEQEHGLWGKGAASLWFVKLEDLDAPKNAELLSRWKGDLLKRFHIQCHEWRHDDHGNFLDAAAVPNCSNSPSTSQSVCVIWSQTVPARVICPGRTQTSSGANRSWPACAPRCSMRRSNPRLAFMASAAWARPCCAKSNPRSPF